LNLRAMRRNQGQELIVPSVIHWRQNHYAAILDQQQGAYLVNDPTFGEPRFLLPEVINEEASGVFLVPAGMQKPAWTELAKAEAETIRGKGLPNNIRDGQDKGCRRNFAGQIECPPCKGTPVYWVSEPWINVFIADEPMSYLTSRGEPFTFRLTYKQRDTRLDAASSHFAPRPASSCVSTRMILSSTNCA